MPHPVIYYDDLDVLLKKWKDEKIEKIANGQCARLPQELTSVGHTSRWQRGERVLDAKDIRSGTVIANFQLVKGKWVFPNTSGFHAGLFYKFHDGKVNAEGKPSQFLMVDQWVGRAPGERGVGTVTEAMRRADARFAKPANDAAQYYVVVVN